MKVKANISLRKFIILLKVGKIKQSELQKLPKPRKFKDVNRMTWKEFVEIESYHRDFVNAIEFLFLMTKKRYDKKAIYVAYPLWECYHNQFADIFKTLEHVNSELPPEKSGKKSMDIFGLTNITDFLSKQKNVSDEVIENWIVAKIITEYTREVYLLVNQLEKIKKSTNYKK